MLVKFHHIHLQAGETGSETGEHTQLAALQRGAAGRLLQEPFDHFPAITVSISLIKTIDLFIFSGREGGREKKPQHAICMMQTFLEKAKKHCVMPIFLGRRQSVVCPSTSTGSQGGVLRG